MAAKPIYLRNALLLALLLTFSIADAQVLNWAKRIGNSAVDIGNRSTVDKFGNLYVLGTFEGAAVDFDPGPGTYTLSSAGRKDGFVAKYNATGAFVWAFRIGGTDLDDISDIALDSAGNFVVTGYFRGSGVDFDPSTNNALLNSNGEFGYDPGYGGDIFVAKYDTAGNYKWAFNVGGNDIGDNGISVAVDKNNDIAVTGYFRSVIDFNPGTGTANLDQATGTFFVAKYSATGQYLWAFNGGLPNVDNTGFEVVTDNLNNVIVTGFFQGSNIDFDPSAGVSTLSSNGIYDFFVAKYSPTGSLVWVRGAGGSQIDVGRSVTVDDQNNVYVTGDYGSPTINFNGTTAANLLTNKGGNDLFVAKYSAAGTHLWSFGVGGVGSEFGAEICRDQNNNVIISGAFEGNNVDFDPSPNTVNFNSNGDADIYAVKYNTDGRYLCSFSLGGTGRELTRGVANFGAFTYLTGSFTSANLDFDPTIGVTSLSAAGADDAFFTKYDWTIIPPAGGITGTSNCVTGQSQLTFTATTGSGPFTLYISNGTITTAYINIQSGVPFSIVPPPNVATTYTLTGIKDANLCSAITPANSIVVIDPSSLPITTSGNAGICRGDSVQLTASGGITYQWSPATGLSNAAIANPKASPSITTVYKVVVTNGAGCKDSTTLTVSINPPPTIVVLPANASFCPGDSVQLNATGGATYQWSPAAGLSNPAIANPKAAPPITTTYRLIVTTADGCKDSVQKVVTRNTSPTAIVSPPAAICPGDTTQLSASGGVNYLWSPAIGLSNAAIANPRAFPTVTTTYKVVVANNQGCRDSTQTTITLKDKPAIVLSSSGAICRGDSVQLTASGGIGYQWSPASAMNNAFIATPKASPSTTTLYKVVVAGANGCTDSSSITVTVNPPPVITISPAAPAFCPGDSVQLAATGGVNYQWSPAVGLSNATIANPKAAPPVTTTYKLVVVDANGCKDSTTKTIVRNTAPVVTISAPAVICPGDSAQLSATGGNSYAWSPSTTISNPSIASPKASPAATTIYKVVVTNAQGCKDSATTTVTVNAKPVVSVSAAQAICKGDSAQLSASGGISYLWKPSASLSSAISATPKASPPTTTTYTVIVTGTNSCRDSAATTVTVNPLPQITITPNTSVCAGDSVQLTATGGVDYQWSPAAGLNNANIASPKASPLTNTIYTVAVTTQAGCLDSAKVIVAVKPKPVIVLSPATTICSGDTTQLAASGGTSYAWTPAASLTNPSGNNPLAYPSVTTVYSVNVTSPDGCRDSASTTISVRQKPTPALGRDSAVCLNDALLLDATTPTATGYAWSTGAITPSITITEAGIYAVDVAVTGCNTPARDTITITDFPDPTLVLRKDTTICSFYTLQLDARGEGITDYLWNTGSTDSFILVNDVGMYTVTVSNRCGDTTASVAIAVDVCAEDLFFPTAFTPNNDGRNDRLQAGYFRGFRVYDYELMIFNRWGEMVFKTKDVDKGWDGIYKGKLQPTGVFVWLAKYRKTQTGAQLMQKGTAALIH